MSRGEAERSAIEEQDPFAERGHYRKTLADHVLLDHKTGLLMIDGQAFGFHLTAEPQIRAGEHGTLVVEVGIIVTGAVEVRDGTSRYVFRAGE